MKKYLYMCLLLLVTSCTHWIYPYEYMMEIEDSNGNTDGTQYVYLVDSIAYDSINFSIVYNKTTHNGFYVPNDFLKKHKKIKDRAVFNDNFAIFKNGGFYYNKDEYMPQRPTFVKFNDEWQIMKAHGLEYFRVYLIRGDVFNINHTQVMDANNSPYMFPYKNGYYRVVVPVRREKE